MNFSRASGVILHPTSLPGPYGIGDLGAEAYKFIDWLIEAGQSLWQVLPLGPTGFGDSPYQCFSAFAGNTLLISPDELVKDELLSSGDLAGAPKFSAAKVDFGPVITWKNALLAKAYANYQDTLHAELKLGFASFCQQYAGWLEDYALFRAIKDEQGGVTWNQWPLPLRRREPVALAEARTRLREAVEAQKFYQFIFFRQWFAVKDYCRQHSIKIIGDIPIFVAFDSADVWCRPDQFKLDSAGNPTVVAGVPPDYFSKTGQLWGNPIYNWGRMEADGFQWWIGRVKATLELYDIVRVDHFRGFAASWEVPGGDKTAERGQWVPVPGKELFTAILRALGKLPVIAEDLGVITPDVEELRDGFNFPGMKILQFGFGGDAKNIDLPHNYTKNCVAYTGTHDNDPVVGWFNSQAGKGSTRAADQIAKEHQFCLDYLGSDGAEIHWDFIRALFASVADMGIVPLQDVLGLGTETRMNLPASDSGNWHWRFQTSDVTDKIALRLAALGKLYGREPQMPQPKG